MAMIEQNITEDTMAGIPEPFKAKLVKEKTKTPPKDEVSSTRVPYADQPAPIFILGLCLRLLSS